MGIRRVADLTALKSLETLIINKTRTSSLLNKACTETLNCQPSNCLSHNLLLPLTGRGSAMGNVSNSIRKAARRH